MVKTQNSIDFAATTNTQLAIGLTTAGPNALDVIGGGAIGSYAGVNTAGSGNLIVSGNVGIGTATTSSGILSVSRASDGVNLYLTFPSSGNFQISQFSGTQYVQTANALLNIGTSTSNNVIFQTNNTSMASFNTNGGMSIGQAYFSSTPPANGLIAQGQVGFGSSSITGATQLTVVPNGSGFRTGINITGNFTYNSTSAESSLYIDNRHQPTANAACSGINIYPAITTGVGVTVPNMYGILVSAGDAASTVNQPTNGYGIYATSPGFGVNRTALYADNGAIGYTGATPPAGGLIVSGNTSIGNQGISNSRFVVSNASSNTSLEGDNLQNMLTMYNSDATNNNWTSICFRANGGSVSGAIGFQNTDQSNAYGDIAFGTRSSLGFSEKMRILSTGQVGIGISNPQELLQVENGNILLENNQTASAAINYVGNTLNFKQRWWSSGGSPEYTGTISGVKLVADGATGGGLLFSTYNSGTGLSEVFRITNTKQLSCFSSSPPIESNLYTGGTWTVVSGNSIEGNYFNQTIKPASTTTNATHTFINPIFDATSATMTTARSLWVNANAKVGSNTITNAYSVYINDPVVGSTNTALFTANAAIGYTATTPPSGGLIVSGNASIGIAVPFSTFSVYGDGAVCGVRSATSGGGTSVECQAYDWQSGPSYTSTIIFQASSGVAGTTCGLSNANLGQLYFQNTSVGLIRTNGETAIIFSTKELKRVQIDGSSSAVRFLNNDEAERLQIQPITGGCNILYQGGDGNVNVTGAYDLTFLTSNAARMTIKSSGLVGVGTASPNNLLDVHVNSFGGISASSGICVSNAYNSSGAMSCVAFLNDSNTEMAGIYGIKVSGTNGALAFATNPGSTGTLERLRINNIGNVGINDTSPGSLLSVVGNAQIGFASGTAAPSSGLIVSGQVAFGTGTATSGCLSTFNQGLLLADIPDAAQIVITNVTQGLTLGTYYTSAVGSNAVINSYSNGIGTAGALILNSTGGNVGIGTTNPQYPLDVINEVRIGGQGGSDFTTIQGGQGYGSQFYQRNPSGTIVNAFRGNNPSYITAGNFGVGDTAPGSTLSVVGNVQIGFTSGTAAPSSGLIVSGQVGMGTSTFQSTSALEIVSIGNYANTELVTNAIEVRTGSTTSTDYTMYLGCDRTNSCSYIQSVQWKTNYAALVLNARGGNVGIGTSSPPNLFQVSSTGSGSVFQGFTNSLSGYTVNDGFIIGFGSDSNAYIYQRENSSMIFGTNNTNVMKLFANGGLALGNSTYLGSTPPSGGFIVSGNVGIGTPTPGWPLEVQGTARVVTLIQGISSITSNSDNGVGLYVIPSIITSAVNSTSYGTIINSQFSSSTGGTFTTGYNCYMSSLSSQTTTLYTLYVNAPTGASNNYTAYFDPKVGIGVTNPSSALQIAGDITPEANKTRNLGSASLRWNTIYYVSATTGTSRLAPVYSTCPQCKTQMVRGTGTTITLGEKADYIHVFCETCGYSCTESLSHLPKEKLNERNLPPKIEFLGLKVVQHSGNSRGIQVLFKYGNNLENSTYLSDFEYDQFLTLSSSERKLFLRRLGEREWYALEELRLMEHECEKVQGELDQLTQEWIKSDLLE